MEAGGVNGIRRVTRCDCQNLERSALLLKQARITASL